MLQEGHTQSPSPMGKASMSACCSCWRFSCAACCRCILRPQYGHKLFYGMELSPCRGRLGQTSQHRYVRGLSAGVYVHTLACGQHSQVRSAFEYGGAGYVLITRCRAYWQIFAAYMTYKLARNKLTGSQSTLLCCMVAFNPAMAFISGAWGQGGHDTRHNAAGRDISL